MNELVFSPRDAAFFIESIARSHDGYLELRVIEPNDGETIETSNRCLCGFWRPQTESQIKAIVGFARAFSGRAKSVSLVINPINEGIAQRREGRLGVAGRSRTIREAVDDKNLARAANAKDITETHWIVIDVDPVRDPDYTDSPANEIERANAREIMVEVVKTIGESNVNPTFVVDSGNGFHCYYRINPAEPVEANEVITSFLKSIARRFNGPKGKIDSSPGSAASAFRIPGTQARKGTVTESRPYRLAQFVYRNAFDRDGNPKPDDQLQQPVDLKVFSEIRDRILSGLPREIESSNDRPPSPPVAGAEGAGQGEYASLIDNSNPKNRANRVARAKWYLEKLAPAVEGQGGSTAFFVACLKVVCGFHLTFEDGLDAISDYNARCIPPFPQSEVERKIADALKSRGRRGHLAAKSNDQLLRDFKRGSSTGSTGSKAAGHGTDDGVKSIRNFSISTDSEGKAVRDGLSAQAIADSIFDITGNWPKRSGGVLFVPSLEDQYLPAWLESSEDLFAWLSLSLGKQQSRVRWSSGESMLSKREFFQALKLSTENFNSVELAPHFPRLPDTYYMHAETPPASLSLACLNGLLKRFNPATAIDHSLIKAFFLSLFWGGEPGTRPVWLIEAAPNEPGGGRGVGKTTLATIAAHLLGSSYILVDSNEDPADLTKRLLSPTGRRSRLVLIDNLKNYKWSSSAFESLVTTREISGRQLFVGEGSRANTLTIVVTVNGPSVSTDIAQRSIPIRLTKPKYDADWLQDTLAYIDQNRGQIVADCLFELAREGEEVLHPTRWSAWQYHVLSKVAESHAVTSELIERQTSINSDTEVSEQIHSAVAAMLERHCVDAKCVKVLIPTSEIARSVAAIADRKPESVSVISVWLRSIEVSNLFFYGERKPYRGFLWIGSEVKNRSFDGFKTWEEFTNRSLDI